jgi:hypothetical protein
MPGWSRTSKLSAALATPTRLPAILLLEPDENENWTAEEGDAFFAETVAWLSEYTPRMEICGVICDKLPAQVVGLLQFMRNIVRVHSTIMHRPCLSDIVNLVFAQAIKNYFFSGVFVMRPEISRPLDFAQSIHLLSVRCPRISD